MKRLFLIALLCGCASRPITSDIESGDAENAIRIANSAFMTNVRAANIDALVNSYYAPDAVLMTANAPAINGRDSIRNFFTTILGGGAVDIALTTDNVMQSCDMATETGHYDFAMTPRSSAPATSHELGKYVVVWRKIGGQWRVVVDSFSANAAAAR